MKEQHHSPEPWNDKFHPRGFATSPEIKTDDGDFVAVALSVLDQFSDWSDNMIIDVLKEKT